MFGPFDNDEDEDGEVFSYENDGLDFVEDDYDEDENDYDFYSDDDSDVDTGW